MSTSRSDATAVAADYFDGASARVHKVVLTLVGDRLRVSGEGIERLEPLSGLRVSEPMGAAARLVSFPDGAHCEVRDHEGFSTLLASSGHSDSWVVRMQQHWRAAAAAVVITVASLVAAYVWGLPALAEWIAFKVPPQVLSKVGEDTLRLLDRAVLEPSELTAARQEDLRRSFARLAPPPGARDPYRLVYRKGAAIGANALALPDGTMVMTDELVRLAGDDEEILAVLAHELGHINRRHAMRMLIQGSIVAFVVAWYLGDVSNVAAGLPTLLLQTRYSRKHELEADRFAAAMLKANGISPRRLADMLEKLEAAHRARQARREEDRDRRRFSDYYATHPATKERMEALGR